MSLWVTAKYNEIIQIGDDISLLFKKSNDYGGICRISIKAPKNIKVERKKINTLKENEEI